MGNKNGKHQPKAGISAELILRCWLPTPDAYITPCLGTEPTSKPSYAQDTPDWLLMANYTGFMKMTDSSVVRKRLLVMSSETV